MNSTFELTIELNDGGIIRFSREEGHITMIAFNSGQEIRLLKFYDATELKMFAETIVRACEII